VKDNFETRYKPTTAGRCPAGNDNGQRLIWSWKRQLDAGAGHDRESNMAEFAFSPVETVSSILPGYTETRTTRCVSLRASSGAQRLRTAAISPHRARQPIQGIPFEALGASGSGRAADRRWNGQSSWENVPLNLASDIAGAVTRTVADTAAVLEVIAGHDRMTR
jgi:Asp-tRNA(Asn)/Glu-tRNA(Gln) amidotransferase A subunit family amidase